MPFMRYPQKVVKNDLKKPKNEPNQSGPTADPSRRELQLENPFQTMPFCTGCGDQVEGKFCKMCGTPAPAGGAGGAPPSAPPPPPYGGPGGPDLRLASSARSSKVAYILWCSAFAMRRPVLTRFCSCQESAPSASTACARSLRVCLSLLPRPRSDFLSPSFLSHFFCLFPRPLFVQSRIPPLT
eukprot:2069965-Rhodomonas_salina.1